MQADRVKLEGRILFLTEDPELIVRQLGGWDMPWSFSAAASNPKLRDDISTDEIIPARFCLYYDEQLGRYPYAGLRCGGAAPIAPGAIQAGGFAACVSGKRRGKGSSREQAPYAEMCAGIRLVIAESFERIYRENCDNLGLLASSDFSCIAAIREGREMAIEAFCDGSDWLQANVVRRGGLLAFHRSRPQASLAPPPIASVARPMSIAEKIIASHMAGPGSVQTGDCGFARTDLRFSHEYVTPMAARFFECEMGPEARVKDPGSVLLFQDHLVRLPEILADSPAHLPVLDQAAELTARQQAFGRKQGIRLHAGGEDGDGGICHSIVFEDYALPGQLIVGSDSHTCHAGALGCFAFGIGTTQLLASWLTGEVHLRVPPVFRAVFHGRCRRGVTAKDLMLALLATDVVRGGGAVGRVIEFAGPAIAAMSVEERATLTNMAVEAGGFTGIIAPDERVAQYLISRRGISENEARRLCKGLESDPGAAYESELEIDAGGIEPMLALPGDPGKGIPVTHLAEETAIDIAYGGACTAGKPSDMDQYAEVLACGLAAGKTIPGGVRFYIQFGSAKTREYCASRGYIDIFRRAGVTLVEPGCGACINAGPGVSTHERQRVISAQNRNFPGRSGPGQLYLASPLTVAASALAGRITAWQG